MEEGQGGVTIKEDIYWYLSFYKRGSLVGLYGSDAADYRRFLSREFDLKGEILEHHDNNLKFYTYNLDTKSNIVFKGKIMNDRKELRLKAFTEENPSNPWIDDVFDLVKMSEAQ